MGIFSELVMGVLSTSLIEYTRKEKVNILGSKVFDLLVSKGKVTLRDVQSEINAIVQMDIMIQKANFDNTYADAAIKEKKSRKPRKPRAQSKSETEKPKRGRKPKAAAANDKSKGARVKRKYTRRKPRTQADKP